MHSHATRYHRQANTLQGATKNERPFYSVCRGIQVTTNRESARDGRVLRASMSLQTISYRRHPFFFTKLSTIKRITFISTRSQVTDEQIMLVAQAKAISYLRDFLSLNFDSMFFGYTIVQGWSIQVAIV